MKAAPPNAASGVQNPSIRHNPIAVSPKVTAKLICSIRSQRKGFQLAAGWPSFFCSRVQEAPQRVHIRLLLPFDVLNPLVRLAPQVHHPVPTPLLLERGRLVPLGVVLEPVQGVEMGGDAFEVVAQILL